MTYLTDIAVNRRGYTEDLYSTCGHDRCVIAVLEAVGVKTDGSHLEEIISEPAGDDTTVSVLLSGETDYDVWCAACGEFLHHGLECDCPTDDTGVQPDRDPARGPHINLKSAPSIVALW